MENDLLYKMIRNMYVEISPSSIPKESLTDEVYFDMIIAFISEEFDINSMKKTENGYALNGVEIDTHKKTNDFPRGSAAYYIKELSHIDTLPDFLENTTHDLKELHDFLISEEYISAGKMTERFINQEKWSDTHS